jgi:N-acetylneuraminic acid mutarotase
MLSQPSLRSVPVFALLAFAAGCQDAERSVAPPRSPPHFSVTVGEGTWTTKAPLRTARGGLSAGVLNGLLYAVGGWNGNVVATVEAYDPATNMWTTRAPMPTPRGDLAVGAINNAIYAVGGYNGGNLSTVEAYDPSTNTWATKASMPTARIVFAAGVVNGTLYAVGGWNGSSYLATVEAYNPATNTWTTKAPMPTARGHLAAGVLNGILYVVGGVGGSTGNLATVEAYDPAVNTWTTKASLPSPRVDLTVGVVNGILYAVGGYTGTGDPPTVEAYNPATNTWTTVAPLPTARDQLASGALNGILYAVGGRLPLGGSSLATVEAYQPASSGVVFESNWTTGTGADSDAIMDRGSATPWSDWNDGSGGSLQAGAHIMEVVSNVGLPLPYTNALRVQQRGSTGPNPNAWADVRKNEFIATPNTDYYVRFYFKTNDVNGTTQDHGVEPWNGHATDDLTYLNKNEGPSGWGFRLTIGVNATDGHGGPWPIQHWNLVDCGGVCSAMNQNYQPLAYNTWYRLEYWVQFMSPDHIRVHPRVYNAAGTLLYDKANFVQDGYLSDAGAVCPRPPLTGGTNDWRLDRWYSRIVTGCNPGGDFQVNPTPTPGTGQRGTTLQGFLMGNNGQNEAQNTGLFWYYAGLQIRTDTWPDP